MKAIIIILFLAALLLKVNPVAGQSNEVKFLIDTTITIMKQHAVNRATVNWDKLRTNALAQAAGINDPYRLGPVIRYLYQSIDDFHGRFFYKDSMFQWQQTQPVFSDSMMNEWKKGVTVRADILENSIGCPILMLWKNSISACRTLSSKVVLSSGLKLS